MDHDGQLEESTKNCLSIKIDLNQDGQKRRPPFHISVQKMEIFNCPLCHVLFQAKNYNSVLNMINVNLSCEYTDYELLKKFMMQGKRINKEH